MPSHRCLPAPQATPTRRHMTTLETPAPDQPSAASDAQDTPIPESSSTSPAMAREDQPDPESEAISPEPPPPSIADTELPAAADLPAGAGSPTEGSPRSRR